MQCLQNVTKFLPLPPKSKAQLTQLVKIKDGNVWKALKVLASPKSPAKAVNGARVC